MGIFSNIFTNSPNGGNLALVFDIGSSSVGAALFQITDSKVPKILFSVRQHIILNEQPEFETLLALTLQAVDNVAMQVAKAGKGAPSRVFCTLSSLWYVSQTRHIFYKKTTDFIFTPKLADGLIAKEISLFEGELKGRYQNVADKMRIIELKTIKTTLNGYETFNPVNQKVKDVEITLFISMSPEAILSKFEERIGRVFHGRKIIFSSFVATSFAIVRDMFISQKNFLLFDISGEVTDISMVKDNVLRESISFPMGRNFMIRGVAGALKVSLDEASSLMSLYNDGHAESGVKEKLDPILDKLKTQWLKKFQESLAIISNDISIPATIFITVSKEFAQFFSDIIENEQFNQYTLTDSKFAIIFLDTRLLHKVAAFEENAARDHFLILDTVYINRFLSKV
jgi:cell division ATPase FtsA